MIKTVIVISLLLLLMRPAYAPICVGAERHAIAGAQKRKAPLITIWSIIKKQKSYFLTKRLISRQSIDKMLAENGPFLDVEPLRKRDKSLMFPGNGSSIVCFAGIGEFQPGALFVKEFPKALVNTFNFPPKKTPFTSSVTFELNGLKYRLSAAVTGSKDGWDMRVYLRQEQKKQLLYSFRQAADAIAALWLIGDIDRDGRPDLLLSTASHYAAVTTTLYLSSRARPGAFVQAVASFGQGD